MNINNTVETVTTLQFYHDFAEWSRKNPNADPLDIMDNAADMYPKKASIFLVEGSKLGRYLKLQHEFAQVTTDIMAIAINWRDTHPDKVSGQMTTLVHKGESRRVRKGEIDIQDLAKEVK